MHFCINSENRTAQLGREGKNIGIGIVRSDGQKTFDHRFVIQFLKSGQLWQTILENHTETTFGFTTRTAVTVFLECYFAMTFSGPGNIVKFIRDQIFTNIPDDGKRFSIITIVKRKTCMNQFAILRRNCRRRINKGLIIHIDMTSIAEFITQTRLWSK
jgi:hypothetical protein